MRLRGGAGSRYIWCQYVGVQYLGRVRGAGALHVCSLREHLLSPLCRPPMATLINLVHQRWAPLDLHRDFASDVVVCMSGTEMLAHLQSRSFTRRLRSYDPSTQCCVALAMASHISRIADAIPQQEMDRILHLILRSLKATTDVPNLVQRLMETSFRTIAGHTIQVDCRTSHHSIQDLEQARIWWDACL